MKSKKIRRQLDYRTYAILALRRASYRWPARSEAVKKARIDRGLYACALCKKAIKTKEKQVDHIDPVVPLDVLEPSLDLIAKRMLCPTDGWQVICKPCHKAKSKLENEQRRQFKKLTTKSRRVRIIKYESKKSYSKITKIRRIGNSNK